MNAKKPAAPKRLVLLDSHAILHRAYHALPDFATSTGEPTGALYGLSSMLIRIIETLKPDYIAAAYDLPGPTHRHEVFDGYKAQRAKTDDALSMQIQSSRRVFEAMGIRIWEKPGFEADDVLGTIVEELEPRTKSGELEIVIASGDMDTLQLVDGERVKVYTLKKGLSDTIMYDEAAVNARFGFGPERIPDYKGLSGDPSDNIPGVKGIGDKTATTLITAFGSIEDIYRALEAGTKGTGTGEKVEQEDMPPAFAAAGVKPRIVGLLRDNKEEAEFSKMLATIRRDAPIEFAMPEQEFKDSLDPAKIGALWKELEFRTLSERLKAVMLKIGNKGQIREQGTSGNKEQEKQKTGGTEGKPKGKKAKKTADAGDGAPNPAQGLFDKTDAEKAGVSQDELEKTAVALWVADSNYTNPKLSDILTFAGTEDFAAAKAAVFAELDRRQSRKVYEDIELPLVPILAGMQAHGVKIDRAALAQLSTDYSATAHSLEKRIIEMAGVEFNLNSPKQLGDILFDKLGLAKKGLKKTAGGARSTRESELEKLRDAHPIIPLIFEYRELTKLLSTYIEAIPPLLDAEDRLHPRLIQAGAATGRMASENPNVQNIPISSELGRAVRRAFVATPGFSLVAIDYSQIELRIAAFLSGDPKLVDIFRRGEDVHRAVASYVFKVPQDKVDHEMRRRAKVINFGILYGMGVNALRANLGTKRDEAQAFYNDYFKEFSVLAAYLDRIKAETARQGYTETFFGRRRYFEGFASKLPYIRAQAERMAVNAPIQGTEADIIKVAMIHIDAYLRKEGLGADAFMLLQVHDELLFEIRDARAAEIAEKLRGIMQSVIDPAKTEGVVMEAKASIGRDWGELK